MDQLIKRRDEVRALRAVMLKRLEEVGQRLSPPQLIDDALKALDPQKVALHRLKFQIKQNPLVAAILFAGVGWFIGNAVQTKRGGAFANRRSEEVTKPETNSKGGYHDTRYDGRDQWADTINRQRQTGTQP